VAVHHSQTSGRVEQGALSVPVGFIEDPLPCFDRILARLNGVQTLGLVAGGMETLLEALRQQGLGLFPTDESATAECKLAVMEHLEQLHAAAATMLSRIQDLEHEAEQLRSLPPPPPIGTEELAAQQDVLENLVAKDEVRLSGRLAAGRHLLMLGL
jgi:hypothetical protein